LFLPSTPHRQHAVDAVLSFLEDNDQATTAAARNFVARVLGLATHEISLDSKAELNQEQIGKLLPLLQRLQSGEPLAYVEGSVGFYKHDFLIDPRALIPRADSEVVVELCLERLTGKSHSRLLDVGCGSGCLIISLLSELPHASGVAIDIEVGALELTALNAQTIGVEQRLQRLRSDCLAGLDAADKFDLIVSNPPYITYDEELGSSVAEYEPHSALFVTDGDAMQFYMRIMIEAKAHLLPKAVLVFEIGANRQDDLARAARECGYQVLEQRKDMCSIVRAISLQLIA
jgi:release factor glutamine methyltransferase